MNTMIFETECGAKKKRSGVFINAHLILERADDVLLLLRQNTGHCDGYYGLIAGHVEDNESASAAIIREAYEEAGIHLDSRFLKMVYVMHRRTDRFNIDLFFTCEKWSGNVMNAEPHKCAALEYFPLKQLPPNTIGYIQEALHAFKEGKIYSEHGWE